MVDRAYEVICQATDPQWLEERNKLVTASDVASLFNCNRYKDYEQLLMEKRSGGATPITGNRYINWGRVSEPFILRQFGLLTGARVRPCNAFLRSRATPLAGATLDGLLRAPRAPSEEIRDWVSGTWVDAFLEDLAKRAGQLGLVEIKNVSDFQRKSWDSAVPQQYWYQVQQQLYVTGLTYAVLVAKVGSADMRCRVIEPDPMFADVLPKLLTDFWRDVNA